MIILLSSGANAADRAYYKLEKDAMVFVSVLDMNRFIELASGEGNIAKEYFNDLRSRKLAMQPSEELIVYKFDKFISKGVVPCCRVKLQKGTIVKYIDHAGFIRNLKFKDEDILGWVFCDTLKKIKQK